MLQTLDIIACHPVARFVVILSSRCRKEVIVFQSMIYLLPHISATTSKLDIALDFANKMPPLATVLKDLTMPSSITITIMQLCS